MNGVLDALLSAGMPEDVLNGIRQANDLNLSFFGNSVSIGAIYGVLVGTILLLLGVFILVNFRRQKRHAQKLIPAK